MTLEQRVQELEGTVSLLIQNLLEPALVGAQLEFGNGVSRLDGLAVQVRSQGSEANAGYGIVFVPQYVTGTAEFNSLAAKAIVESTLDEANSEAILTVRPITTEATGRSELSMRADTASVSMELNMTGNEASLSGHAIFAGGPVRLPTKAGGYTLGADGDLDYDTTADKMRLRQNGSTVNIATEGYANTVDHGGLTGLADDDHTQYLLANGTRALSADWDAGSVEIRAQTFESDVTTGTAPLVIASTTKVTNLNADLLDDQSGAYYLDSANFTGTNWTDLTDGTATTLHTHSGGGGMKKVQGSGYQPLPAGPGAGVTVTKSASANTYGSYAEIRSASGNAIYIFGVLAEDWTGTNSYGQISIGTGGAGVETEIGVVKMSQITATPTANYAIFFPAPLAVGASTRIAARWAGNAASADTCILSLITCNQSDLADI